MMSTIHNEKQSKISLLTFSKAYSYGANMQCYALSKVLKDRGCMVELVNLELPNPKSSLKEKIVSRIFNKIFNKFRRKYFPVYSKKYTSLQELKANPPIADLYIVGSDQVWNLDITVGLGIGLFFFEYLPKRARRISYAGSFGKSTWEYSNHTANIKQLLSKFESVSVRENEAVNICKDVFNIETTHVLDPTLLIDDYSEFLDPKEKQTNDLFYFSLFNKADNNAYILEYARRNNLNPITLSIKPIKGFKVLRFMSIIKWIRTIHNSKFIITDSFHGLIFSVIFKKQFIIIPGVDNRHSRILDLLNDFKLSHRFCKDTSDILIKNIYSEIIDYTNTDEYLVNKRVKSYEFIDNIINKL